MLFSGDVLNSTIKDRPNNFDRINVLPNNYDRNSVIVQSKCFDIKSYKQEEKSKLKVNTRTFAVRTVHYEVGSADNTPMKCIETKPKEEETLSSNFNELGIGESPKSSRSSKNIKELVG